MHCNAFCEMIRAHTGINTHIHIFGDMKYVAETFQAERAWMAQLHYITQTNGMRATNPTIERPNKACAYFIIISTARVVQYINHEDMCHTRILHTEGTTKNTWL